MTINSTVDATTRWRVGFCGRVTAALLLLATAWATVAAPSKACADEVEAIRRLATRSMGRLPCIVEQALSSFRNPETNRLCRAIVDRDLDECQRAIRQGAGINDIGRGGTTPLTIAYFCYDESIFDLLLTSGGNPNFPVTDESALQRVFVLNKSVTMMTSYKTDMSDAFEKVMANGGSPLGPVVRRGSLLHYLIFPSARFNSRIKLLLDHGADIEQPDQDGYSPLIASVAKARRFDIAMLLIEYGADYRARGPRDPWSFVHYVLHIGRLGEPLTPEQEAGRQQLLRKLQSLGISIEYAEYELYIGSLNHGINYILPPKVSQAMGLPVPARYLELEVPDYIFNNYDLTGIGGNYNPASVRPLDPSSERYRQKMPN